MHLALVSTYPPTRCGIANYTEKLALALRAEGIKVTILAESLAGAPVQEDVLRCWDRKGNWVTDIAEALARLGPELVHFQHEEAILGQDRRLADLLQRARGLGIASVVTLHSVYAFAPGVPGFRLSGRSFQESLGQSADRLIVHQVHGCQDTLIDQGVDSDKIVVIPHGTSMSAREDKEQARAKLGLPASDPLILAIGFIHKKKGLHTLVDALAQVRRRVPKARLLVAGSFRERPWDFFYNRSLRGKMKPGLRDGSIDLREEFHSSETMNTMLAAADLLALPYQQRYGSASGILHMALGAGMPVLCADGYKFAEAKAAWIGEHPSLFPAPDDVPAWAEAMSEILGNEPLATQLARASATLGEASSWPRVAQQHIAAFAAAVAGGPR